MTHPLATAQGKRLRKQVLIRDQYTCQMCGILVSQGRHKSNAATVDHTVPATLAPELTFDASNLRTVCKRCHDSTCATIEAQHAGDAEAIRAAKLEYDKGLYRGWAV